MSGLSLDADFVACKNIPPAFAGLLVDWSLGSREITATALDLIVRGKLRVQGRTVHVSSSSGELRPFEGEFIDIIFNGAPQLSFKRFGARAYKECFDALLRCVARGMKRQGYLVKDLERRMARAVIKSVSPEEVVEQDFRHPSQRGLFSTGPRPQDNNVYVIPSWVFSKGVLGLFLLSLFIWFLFPRVGSVLLEVLFYVVLFLVVPIWLKMRQIRKGVVSRLGKGNDWMLTVAGRSAKEHVLRLQAFMAKYPLFEDRLANIFVGHAVALGFGKRWMRKLGKSNADMRLLFESWGNEGDTIVHFIDWEVYTAYFS